MTLREDCKTCKGSGEISHRRYFNKKHTCPTCKGKGYTTKEEEKKIPLEVLNRLINDSNSSRFN